MGPEKPTPPGLSIMLILLAIFTLNGCDYLKFWSHQEKLEDSLEKQPSASALMQLRPRDTFLLSGEVTFNREYKKPILVAAVSDKFKRREVVLTKIVQAPVKAYDLFLLEGSYDLYFLADLNGDGFFEASETIGHTSGTPVNVTRGAVKDGLTFKGPAFSLDLDKPVSSGLPIRVAVKERPYVFDSLDDEFFDSKYGKMGYYYPEKFAAHTQRNFFALEKFDPSKTMVLFVHGVRGTPRDFKYLVQNLDRRRFQPWFYYYPSNLPLEKLGVPLAGAIDYIGKSHNSSRIIVVAHSMGGLVALSALNALCTNGAPPYLKGYISFDSPYGGVKAAEMGKKAPAKIPSWSDVPPGCEFLTTLYRGKATSNIPFYLFFGYETGKSGDGSITLQSQLEHRIHLNASKSYGFNATHVGIVNDERARQQFLKILDVLVEQ
jgi:pimeloyl-ACP methyl ester carboxylesterase